MKIAALKALAVATFIGSVTTFACADVSVPSLFTDNMVLQRSASTPIWGKADPGVTVRVQLLADNQPQPVQSADATVDQTGKWMVRLNTTDAPAQTYRLTITGRDNEIQISNVLVGQVWLASGQSNMEWPVRASHNSQQEIAAANYPDIREFRVPHKISMLPTDELVGQWVITTPQTVPGFSAVGYFFARYLHQQLNTPIGIIHSSWGGTTGEAWVSAQGLEPVGDFNSTIQSVQAATDPQKVAQWHRDLEAWTARLPAGAQDVTPDEQPYLQPDFDDSAWKSITLPALVERSGMDVDGVIWFRRTVELPQAPTTQPVLRLGRIDDFDQTFINGKRVGGIGFATPNASGTLRGYKIPDGVLHAGVNTIEVRVLDIGGAGGFAGPASQMKLEIGKTVYPLTGEWRVHHEASIDPEPFKLAMRTLPRQPGGDQNSPTTLFNGMINPIVPYGIAGAIWYQGESNAGRDQQYVKILSSLIQDWRAQWNQPDQPNAPAHHAGGHDFPFYIVQLAGFYPYQPDPNATGSFAHLREAQQEVARTIPNTDLAVIFDIGDARDIHPRNKQDVGKRLALIALHETYGKNVEYSGPRLEGAKLSDGKVLLTFSHTTGGLVAASLDDPSIERPSTRAALVDADTPVKGFTLRDADGKWHFARAVIVDDHTVAVSADSVPHPTAIRYAFVDNPVANLYNAEQLPANPFEVTLTAQP